MNHESFHYYCDYKRHLTGAKFDRNTEEAFAVAHAYQEAPVGLSGLRHHHNSYFRKYYYNKRNYQLSVKRLDAIINFVIKEHYKGYTAPGYRDWHLYTGRNSYETHFYDYLKNSKLDSLLKNNVPVNDISGEILLLGNRGADIRLV